MGGQNYRIFWDEALKQIREEYKAQGQESDFLLWFNMTYEEDTLTEITVSVPSAFMWTSMANRGNVKKVEDKIAELCGQIVQLKPIIKKIQPAPQQAQASIAAPVEVYTQNAPETQIQGQIQQETDFAPISQSAPQTVPVNSQIQEETDKKPSFFDDIFDEMAAEAPTFVKHPDLREEFTFDRFVMGENSKFAFSLAKAVANDLGNPVRNPLLIYGPSGLGKTHLMQSIGNEVYNNPPEGREHIKIKYCSAESFLNDYTAALRDRKEQQFKDKYRKLDLLLLDDIYFLEGKERIQDEFFYTLNALFDIKSQVVLTCDRPIKEFKGLDVRISGRLGQGTIIDIQMPTYETRKAILQKKLELQNKEIPDDVVDYVAKNVQSNVRDLEGCLNRLTGFAELIGKELTIDIAKDLLKNNLINSHDSTISIDTIQKVVANHYNISLRDIKGTKRSKNFVTARQIAVYIARKLTECSFTELGTEFGGRDHSTIMHSFEKINDLCKTDETMASTIEILTREVREYRNP